jgi:hypothetical protein
MKRGYMKPTAKVVAIQQQQHLLGVSGEISGYRRSEGKVFTQEEGEEN